MSISRLLLSAGLALLVFVLWKVANHLYCQYKSPIRKIPGPKSSHWVYGNIRAIFKTAHDDSFIYEKWVEKYGPTFKYYGFLNTYRLCTVDTRAVNHIITHNYDYQKPEQMQYPLSEILGGGVLFVEADQHKQQRKIMNPAFGPIQIRELTEIFTAKSIKLRDMWLKEIAKTDSTGRIDVLYWLRKMALDVIGLAGFNYEFNALDLNEKLDELNNAFQAIVQIDTSALQLLQTRVPILRAIPTRRKSKLQAARITMARIGHQLLDKGKIAATELEQGGKESGVQGRDLLSLLIRANMFSDLPDSKKLSDENVLAQVPTFLIAGHETTSMATTWALFALTQAPDVQTKLREELLSLSTENPTMDELSSLRYLDAVVRETLRVHSPVQSCTRVATKDDVIPLGTPFVDKNGETQHSIKVTNGDQIIISITALNRSKSIWGEDAAEFKPERWESVPEDADSIPGIWGKQLSFLGGPRACIGYKFAIIEMKALLFTLIRSFELELAVPSKDIHRKRVFMKKPVVATELEVGEQMPLLIKPYCP